MLSSSSLPRSMTASPLAPASGSELGWRGHTMCHPESPAKCASTWVGASLVAHGSGLADRRLCRRRYPIKNWPRAQGTVFDTWAGDAVFDHALHRAGWAQGREEYFAWCTHSSRPPPSLARGVTRFRRSRPIDARPRTAPWHAGGQQLPPQSR